MWKPKGCSRCGGDLYQTVSEDGLVLSCLQCGREFLAVSRRASMTDAEVYALFHEEHPVLAA
jgi:hypothetical protein